MAEWWEDSEVVEPVAPQAAAPVIAPQAPPNQVDEGEWWAGSEEIDPQAKEPPTPDEIAWYEHIPGAGETALTFLSGAVGEVAGGIAGIGAAMLPGEAGQGADVSAAVSDALTYEAGTDAGQAQMQGLGDALAPVGEVLGAVESGLGETVLDATGSPLLATAAHTLPTAAMELLGLGALKKASGAATRARAAIDKSRDPLVGEVDAEKLVDALEPEARTIEEITADITKKKAGRLAQDVQPDAEVLKAAEELGIILNPSHYSTNEAYKAVEQAIKSQPNTALAARELEAIKQLAARGDELITDLDGMLDRSILDDTVRSRMDDTIKGLEDNAEQMYRQIDDVIPRATKINPRTAQKYVDQRLAELGDDIDQLAPVERKLLRMLSRDKPPTYNALDTLRRDIGNGYKNQGPFKNESAGVLDQVYSVLIKDQQLAADAMGAGGEFAAARKLVQTRKNVEKRAMTMFGRQMDKSVLPKLTQAATKMTKGDVSEFKNLMEALPPDLRQQAAATMLNDIFTLGARSKTGGIGQGFANAYDALERNAGAKAVLFKYLPDDAQRRFDALGKVARGIFRAKALENTSRTARDILQALDQGTLAQRIVSTTVGGAARVAGWKTAGHFGAAAADQADKLVKKTLKNDQAADELLSSNAFEKALNKAMEGKTREADLMIKRSEAWRRWRGRLGEGTRAQIAVQGPIAWLTQRPKQEQQQPQAVPNAQ